MHCRGEAWVCFRVPIVFCCACDCCCYVGNVMAIEGIILKQEKKSIVPPMFCAFLSFILLFHDFPSTFGIGKHLWGLKPCIFSREHLQDDLCFKPSLVFFLYTHCWSMGLCSPTSPFLPSLFQLLTTAHPWVSVYARFCSIFLVSVLCSSDSQTLFVQFLLVLCSSQLHTNTHTHTHTHTLFCPFLHHLPFWWWLCLVITFD